MPTFQDSYQERFGDYGVEVLLGAASPHGCNPDGEFECTYMGHESAAKALVKEGFATIFRAHGVLYVKLTHEGIQAAGTCAIYA